MITFGVYFLACIIGYWAYKEFKYKDVLEKGILPPNSKF